MEKILDQYDPEKFIRIRKHYVHAHGGDGTLLRAISEHRHLGLPFFGTAAGTVNFLMNKNTDVSVEATYKTLKLIKIEVSHMTSQQFYMTTKYIEVTDTYYAFNDLVLGGFNAWINFDCHHKDDILGFFKGSGLIIATAQGSTGANKNNHGTVLPLSSKDWAISGVMCNRNIDYVINPDPIKINVSSRNAPISIGIDGTQHLIKNVTSIKVTQDEEVTVIFNDYHDFKKKRQLK